MFLAPYTKPKGDVLHVKGEEALEPGDAFYLPPGHVPAAAAGTEFVMFSPQDELAAMEAAMRENMRLKMQKGRRPTALFCLTVTAAIGVALLPAAGTRRNRR
jgi:GGDEF domain-containing protein